MTTVEILTIFKFYLSRFHAYLFIMFFDKLFGFPIPIPNATPKHLAMTHKMPNKSSSTSTQSSWTRSP